MRRIASPLALFTLIAHYTEARSGTVVPVHAMGPFAVTSVNLADTPKATAGR